MTTPPAGVDFTPEAVEEARSAFVWYQERSELAARAFLSELDQAILRILEAPRTWPRYRSGTRRCLLERFPFSIVYREARERIENVAVAHAKRRPGYWRKR